MDPVPVRKRSLARLLLLAPAAVLFVAAFFSAWETLVMLRSVGHFGSPAMQVCRGLEGSGDEMVRACRTLGQQVAHLHMLYGEATFFVALGTAAMAALGVVLLILALHKR